MMLQEEQDHNVDNTNNVDNTDKIKEILIWDIETIFNYIVEHYKQFLLLLLSIIVVIIVDNITYYNSLLTASIQHPMTQSTLISPTINIIKHKNQKRKK